MSFRKAGELLNLTQPAVSAQIKSLEDEFKTVLVDRNQPVTLTDRGEVFLSHAERILAIVEELKERLYDLDQTPQGHIVLGTTTSIAIQILPRVLSYFQNQFPLIKTSIMSMASSQIYTSVENGQIDVGLGYLIERNPNLMTSVLRFADDILKKHGIEPNVVMELSSSEEIKRMVEIDLGAAIMSKQSVASELRLGTLKIIPLTELEVSHPVGVIYKSGKYLNSAMQQFLSDLKGMPETNFISSE
ncbi:hypothetical protein BGX30_002322 [Mortierella sp. GBA39]|nr:hypothetical protein BGX30_002322 [Mortierella sp. GBA39]